jgi:hypothetical protein
VDFLVLWFQGRFTAIYNCGNGVWLSAVRASPLKPLNSLVSFHYHSKNDMFPIEPLCFDRRYKKLRAVAVSSRIRHCQHHGAVELDLEGFVRESFSKDRLSSCTISIGIIASLYHKIRNYSMKGRALVACRLSGYRCGSIAASQSPEIFHRLGSDVTKEAKDDSMRRSVVTNFDIKIDAMRYFRQSSVMQNGYKSVRWMYRSVDRCGRFEVFQES